MTPDERDATMRELAHRISAVCEQQDAGCAIGAAALYIVAQVDIANDTTFRLSTAAKLRQVAAILDSMETRS